ncbi:MAG: 1-acyl-sn-glycerol-3-phosphate acyltransferase, partial [Clostridia bacterium]
IRKPLFWLYYLPIILAKPIIKFWYKHKIERINIRGVKSPVLALANHASTMDIVFAALALFPKRFNIVAAKDLFTWPKLKPFIVRFGAIAKNQMSMDVNALRQMKATLKNNQNVLVFPEGKTCIDGKGMEHLPANIGKFVKMMDSNVVIVNTNGSFLTKPRWFHGVKRGKVESKVYQLLSQEELRKLSAKEVYEKVAEALSYNDNIWQRENNVEFTHKNYAKGMEYVLYKCPKCGAEYQMSTDANYLTCANCGNKVVYTSLGYLLPAEKDSKSIDRIDLWADMEREEVLKEIQNEDFSICKKVILKELDHENAEYIETGEGELYINRKVIGYKGTRDGKDFVLEQALKNLNTIITKNQEGVDLVEGDGVFRCLFTEHKWSAKYGFIVEQIYALENNLIDPALLEKIK